MAKRLTKDEIDKIKEHYHEECPSLYQGDVYDDIDGLLSHIEALEEDAKLASEAQMRWIKMLQKKLRNYNCCKFGCDWEEIEAGENGKAGKCECWICGDIL